MNEIIFSNAAMTVAGGCGLLAAVFKEEKGISMQRLHDRLRMNEACRLLKSILMPVSEAAAAVGFSDPLYFSRRFREIIGSSPTDFRISAAEMF